MSVNLSVWKCLSVAGAAYCLYPDAGANQ